MQYQGGKERIAKHIAAALAPYTATHSAYLEPFMGGASIASRIAPLFPGAATVADADPDLVALWIAARDGWEPPTSVSRDEYAALKRETYPSAARAFAAYGCSFGGKKWGGYASNARGDDFAGAARRGVLKKAAGLQGATILRADYADHAPTAGTLVYCDPPYAGTTPYTGADRWDPELFWNTMDKWTENGATVLVSEYAAPDHWAAVWEGTRRTALAKDDNLRVATERLFVRSAA